MPKFSIIIPVYNASKYLQECLDSVLSQTIDDYEVIIVDDGSTDDSARIIDEYASKDNRLTIRHKANGGVSTARNMGIEMAKGDYLCFVDADDVIASNYLESLYNAMGEEADSAMGGFQVFFCDGRLGATVVPECEKIETLEENLTEFYDYQKPQWQHYLWNRMFRASVIREHSLRFREDIYYKEDGLFVVQFLCASNGKVGCSNQLIYHYRVNREGAMSHVWKEFDQKLITNLVAHQQLILTLQNKAVSSLIIDKAKSQAKSIANWIQVLLRKHCLGNLAMICQTESLMIDILGRQKYVNWRLYRILRLWK